MPARAQIRAGETQSFFVIGSGPPVSPGKSHSPRSRIIAVGVRPTNRGVFWSVNGIRGGSVTVGTIDARGLYTAPATLPNPNLVKVTAISAADLSLLATAAITLENPIPTVMSVSPAAIPVGSFTLTVNGSRFVNGAQVLFAGKALQTTFKSASQLTANGTGTLVGNAQISVKNPDPGSASSTTVLNVQVASAAVSVSTSPNNVVLQAGRDQQFVTRVTGTADTTVTWLVANTRGGSSSLGTISPTGLYTAPQTVPPNSSFVVTARSNADPTKSGSATVIITPLPTSVSVSISPRNASLQTGLTKQFAAIVTGTTNASIVWLVNGIPGGNAKFGSISSSGLYVTPPSLPAPPVVTISAKSQYDPSSSADATMTITAAPAAPVAPAAPAAPAQGSSGTGVTYYVDDCVVAGDDSNNGTSTATPWLTVSKVNSSTFAPGDSVLFQRGCLWRETLTVSSSGSPGSLITFGNYGTSTALPVITATDLVGGWSEQGALNVWQTNIAYAPSQVFLNGTHGTLKASVSALSAPNDWFFNSGKLYVYEPSNPTALLSSPGVEAAHRTVEVAISAKNYIRIQGLDIWGGATTTRGTVYAYNSTGIVITGNTIHDNDAYAGIYLEGSGNSAVLSSNQIFNIRSGKPGDDRGDGIVVDGSGGSHTVTDNVLHDNMASGARIGFFYVTNNDTISYNTCYNNGSTGISYGSNAGGNLNGLIEKNLTYNNGLLVADTAGIDLYKPGNSTIVRYNMTHDHHYIKISAQGIRFDGGNSPGISVTGTVAYGNVMYHERVGFAIVNFRNGAFYNNTIYDSSLWGLDINGEDSDGMVVTNNIISTAGAALVRNNDATKSIYNNNLYYPDGSAAFLFNGSSSNFDAWKTISGQDANSVVEDPKFCNISGLDFRICK